MRSKSLFGSGLAGLGGRRRVRTGGTHPQHACNTATPPLSRRVSAAYRPAWACNAYATPCNTVSVTAARQGPAVPRARPAALQIVVDCRLSIVNALDWEILKLPWTTAAGPSRDRSIPHEGPRNPLTLSGPIFEPDPTRGKNETCGTSGLIGACFRGIHIPGCCVMGEEDGNDTDDTNRSGKNTKPFDSSYRKTNVGHRRRRFYLWTLWVCYVAGF